jgi:hypothetical protein
MVVDNRHGRSRTWVVTWGTNAALVRATSGRAARQRVLDLPRRYVGVVLRPDDVFARPAHAEDLLTYGLVPIPEHAAA